MKNRRDDLEVFSFQTHIDGAIFGWLRRGPVDPAEQRWLDEVCALAFACSVEVQGVDPDTQLMDLCLVGRAAEQLWAAEQHGATAPGAPCWRSLDADAYFARLDQDAPGMRTIAFSALLAFVYWMRDAGRLSTVDLVTLRARLDRHVPAALLDMGYAPSLLPAALQPS